ncbi:MAG: hypothetical protein F6K21_06940 [Symploca sp. SIO2D2]|nr:hypothetical protein [Symploca sp. SIO2D2]
MKKLLSWKSLALALLGVMGISVSIFLAQPSQATSANYQRMIELGFIDGVKSPEELGLDYLRQKPPELTAGLVDEIRYINNDAKNLLNLNANYAIPLGTRSPIQARVLPNDNGGTLNATNCEAVGYFTQGGQPKSFTGKEAIDMFTAEERNGGSFDIVSGEQQNLVADASSSFLQAQRIAIIDLIVRDKRNGAYYPLRNIRVDSFCRDALNAVANRTYRRYNGNLRSIRF